jgi:hypothetical protein
MKRILFAAAAGLALMMAVSTTPSSAKKVSNDRAANLLSICLLNGGRTSEPQGNGSYVRCCTKAGGFCIICKQDGSGLCNKTPYRAWSKNATESQAPASGSMAPAETTGRNTAPSLKLGR